MVRQPQQKTGVRNFMLIALALGAFILSSLLISENAQAQGLDLNVHPHVILTRSLRDAMRADIAARCTYDTQKDEVQGSDWTCQVLNNLVKRSLPLASKVVSYTKIESQNINSGAPFNARAWGAGSPSETVPRCLYHGTGGYNGGCDPFGKYEGNGATTATLKNLVNLAFAAQFVPLASKRQEFAQHAIKILVEDLQYFGWYGSGTYQGTWYDVIVAANMAQEYFALVDLLWEEAANTRYSGQTDSIFLAAKGQDILTYLWEFYLRKSNSSGRINNIPVRTAAAIALGAATIGDAWSFFQIYSDATLTTGKTNLPGALAYMAPSALWELHDYDGLTDDWHWQPQTFYNQFLPASVSKDDFLRCDNRQNKNCAGADHYKYQHYLHSGLMNGALAGVNLGYRNILLSWQPDITGDSSDNGRLQSFADSFARLVPFTTAPTDANPLIHPNDHQLRFSCSDPSKATGCSYTTKGSGNSAYLASLEVYAAAAGLATPAKGIWQKNGDFLGALRANFARTYDSAEYTYDIHIWQHAAPLMAWEAEKNGLINDFSLQGLILDQSGRAIPYPVLRIEIEGRTYRPDVDAYSTGDANGMIVAKYLTNTVLPVQVSANGYLPRTFVIDLQNPDPEYIDSIVNGLVILKPLILRTASGATCGVQTEKDRLRDPFFSRSQLQILSFDIPVAGLADLEANAIVEDGSPDGLRMRILPDYLSQFDIVSKGSFFVLSRDISRFSSILRRVDLNARFKDGTTCGDWEAYPIQ